MNKFINKSYDNLSGKSHNFANAKPFPHIILDDFLTDDFFQSICAEIKQTTSNQMGRSFNSTLEKEKSISLNTKIPQTLKELVCYLNSGQWIENLTRLSKMEQLIGTENGNTDLANYHEMRRTGFLGSHVDHASEPKLGLPHVLNIVLYLSEDWREEYGGDTILFDAQGKRAVLKVPYRPNRAIIFLHTPYSFHGVSEISSFTSTTRKTLYVDYYSHSFDPYKNLDLPFPNVWFDHPTTFIFPNYSSYFSPKNWLYLKLLMKYRINKKLSFFKKLLT